MRELLRRTWLPAVLFALPIFLFELANGRSEKPLPVGSLALFALIAVPPVWWRTAAMHGRVSLARGAASGALCGAVLVLIPAMIAAITVLVNPGDGAGTMVWIMGFTVLAIAMVILVPLGAVIGALTALLLRRSPAERPS